MVMVVDGRASQSAGCEEGVVAVLVLVLLWQQASEAGEGWSFSCRSRSKLQQTSGKALPMERKIDRKEGKTELTISQIICKLIFQVYFHFHLSFIGGSDLQNFFKVMPLLRYAAVGMNNM